MNNSSTCGVAAPPLIDLEVEKEDLTIPVLIPSSSSSTLKSAPPPPPQTDGNSTPKTMVIPGRFKCNLCGLAYSNINSVYKHKKKKHSNAGFSVKKRHTCKACGTRLQSKIEWIRHTRLHCSKRESLKQDTSNEQPITIPKLKDLTQLMSPVLQVKSGNNRLVCALCPPPSLQFNKTSQLRKHLFCNHPEYVFDPVKLPEKDTEQFNELCVELIRDEMALSQQESDEQQGQGDNDDGTSSTIAYTCVYCSYVCHEKRTMNVHLIQVHYEVLCSTLVDLQNHHSEPSSVEMAPSSPPVLRPTAEGSGWAKCQDCGKLLKVGSSFNRHRRLYCEKRINASTGVGESVTSDKKSGRKRRLEEQGTENTENEQVFGGYDETDTLDDNEDENDDLLPGSFLNVKCEVLDEMERQGDDLLDMSSMEEEDGE